MRTRFFLYVIASLNVVVVGCTTAPNHGQSVSATALSSNELVELRSRALERLMFIISEAAPATKRTQFLIDLASDDNSTQNAILAQLDLLVRSRFAFKSFSRQSTNAYIISADLYKFDSDIVTIVGRVRSGPGELGIFLLEFSKSGNSFTYRGISSRASS